MAKSNLNFYNYCEWHGLCLGCPVRSLLMPHPELVCSSVYVYK